MNYGDRQDRAEMLVTMFRASNTTHDWNGRSYSSEEIANEIENMTDLGQSLVAVAGMVLAARAATPEFFAKRNEAAPPVLHKTEP